MSSFFSVETQTTNSIDSFADDVGTGSDEGPDVSLLISRIAVVVVGVIGALDNGLVLYVIYRVTDVRKKLGNLYIIHQCIVDLICSVFLIVLYSTLLSVQKVFGYWGRVLCKAILSEGILWGLFTLSTFNLVLMNVDRYITIVHPKKKHYWRSKKVGIVSIIACWVCAFGSHLFVQVMTSDVIEDHCYQNIIWPSFELSQAWGYAVFISVCGVPLFTFAFVYVNIYVVVRRSKLAVASSSSNSYSSSSDATQSDLNQPPKVSKEEKEVLKTLVLVCLVYTIFVTPTTLYYLLYNVGYDLNFSNGYYYFFIVLGMANCATNPFAYLAKLKSLRSALKLIFDCCL